MDISAEVAAIQAASQGSELRQPLVGALNKLNSGTLPAVTVSDVGKILKVGANGWEVGEKSGYMPVPTATKQITENGTYDITGYASAVVNVSGGGSDDGYIKNGLVLRYDGINNTGSGHNNSSQIWKDISGFNHDANIGSLSWGNSGLLFNGNTGIIIDEFIRSNTITSEVVFKIDSLPSGSNYAAILGTLAPLVNYTYTGFQFTRRGNKMLSMQIAANTGINNIDSGMEEVDGTYYIMTATISPTTCKLYMNGVLVQTYNLNSSFISYANVLKLGETDNTIAGSYARFIGEIKHASMYARVLSDEEVSLNYTYLHNRFLGQ